MSRPDDQLLDVTVIIGFVEQGDSSTNPFAVSKIVRIDYDGSPDDLIKTLDQDHRTIGLDVIKAK